MEDLTPETVDTELSDIASRDGRGEVETTPEPASIRDAVAQAFEKTDQGEGETPEKGERARDGKTGQFVEKAKEPKQKATSTATGQRVVPVEKRAQVQGGTTPAASAGAPSQAAPSPLKAPQSWNAQERELWAKIPPEVQKAIHDREGRMTKAATGWRQLQDFQDAFRQTLAPFEGLMRNEAASQGVPYNPLGAVRSVLQTAASLRHPDPSARASVVARLMSAYAVDPAMVAAHLSGQASLGMQPQAIDPNRLAAQVAQQTREQLQREWEAANQQRTLQKTSAEIEEWSKDKEFFEDVRESMAAFYAAHAERMRTTPPAERVALDRDTVYRMACLADPNVAPLYEQREKAAAAEKANASTQQAARAASSIRSSPVGSMRPKNSKPANEREALMAAWEQLEA